MLHIIRVTEGTLIMDLFVKNAICINYCGSLLAKGESLSFHNSDNNIFRSNILIFSANPF
jgi:hypothetical protein